MVELIELIKEGILWLVPIESIKANPYIPIYIFFICIVIGFLIINYKYIIQDFNKTYENINYSSKLFLAVAVGFIITLTGTTILLALNTISSTLFQESILNNYAGMIILLFSFMIGFIYFISMQTDDKNPFIIIKKLYSILFKLMVMILITSGIVIFIRAVYLSQTKNIFMRTFKVLAEIYLIYFLFKTIKSISDEYYKDYKKKFFFSKEVDYITSKIEKIYSFLEGQFLNLLRKAKQLI